MSTVFEDSIFSITTNLTYGPRGNLTIKYICSGPYGYSDRTRMVRTGWCILIGSDFQTVLVSTKQARVRNRNGFILKYFTTEKKAMPLQWVHATRTGSLIRSRTCHFSV